MSQRRSRPKLPNLIPPFRYGIVEHGIYRGAYPTLRNYRFLDRLRLRTIVSLTPFPPIADLEEYCTVNYIDLRHIEVPEYTEENMPLPFQQAISVVEMLVDTSLHPLYLHCMDGTHVIGGAVMCLRRLQNWALPAIKAEAQRFLQDEKLEKPEVKFIQTLNGDVEVPKMLPAWLRGGRVPSSHPCFRISVSKQHGEVKGPPSPGWSSSTEASHREAAGLPSISESYTHAGAIAIGGSSAGVLGAMTVEGLATFVRHVTKAGPASALADTRLETERKYSMTLEALLLEGLTMRGSLYEHEAIVRASGATKRSYPYPTCGRILLT